MTVGIALALPYDVASGALGGVHGQPEMTVPVTAGGSAPAVAGLVDQHRRERRLIQKAPADSAIRTPIHPAKRSSEDRCIVSGSSIDDEGTPDGAWSHRRREPQRTSKSASRPSPPRT
jgi:hypothetical protein